MIRYIVDSQDSIAILIDDKTYVIDKTHHAHSDVLAELKSGRNNIDRLKQLLDIAKAVKELSCGKVTVRDNVIYYGEEALHHSMCDRVMEIVKAGGDFQPFLAFIDNLMQNPSQRSVEQLYDFLGHKGLPITADGCVLAYKKVRNDYRDWYSGKFINKPGTKHVMRRNAVNDNPNETCSYGYHVGAYSYAANEFHPGEGRVVLVKFNPKDAVSVPTDHCATKLRVCEYEVVCDYNDSDVLPFPIYEVKGGEVEPSTFKNEQTAQAGGMFDNTTASHWESRDYDDDDDDYDGSYDDDYEEEDEYDEYDYEDEDDFYKYNQ